MGVDRGIGSLFSPSGGLSKTSAAALLVASCCGLLQLKLSVDVVGPLGVVALLGNEGTAGARPRRFFE